MAAEDGVIGAYTVLLGETGMRKSEGLRLKGQHIRQRERMVLIGRAKSGKVRSVPLSDLALEWLGKVIRFIDIPLVFVDPVRNRPWLDPRTPFARGKAKANLEWVGFHGLRHFRATQWLIHGVDVNTVKELLGHATIQTTMRYAHYVQTHALKAVRGAQRNEAEEWRQSVDTKRRQGR
ncbi:MAG TPA: site-specific integrase [Acidobacteriota bacterium]|nr:site-specific integrase [Acidobacteriota bacterium]